MTNPSDQERVETYTKRNPNPLEGLFPSSVPAVVFDCLCRLILEQQKQIQDMQSEIRRIEHGLLNDKYGPSYG